MTKREQQMRVLTFDERRTLRKLRQQGRQRRYDLVAGAGIKLIDGLVARLAREKRDDG